MLWEGIILSARRRELCSVTVELNDSNEMLVICHIVHHDS